MILRSKQTENRRGVAGTVLVHKIAGAKAERGASLDQVKRLAEHTISNLRSMGVALSSCINPSVGRPIFSLGENEMEIGIGIHGERGVERVEIAPADEIAEILYRKISNDLDLKKGEEVFLLVNGMGGTPLMELLIVSRKVRKLLNLGWNRAIQSDGRKLRYIARDGGFLSVPLESG